MKTSLFSFLILLILISSFTSQSDQSSKKFTLQGEIKDQDSGIVILRYFSNATLIRDTAEIKRGKFIFTGSIFEPITATLRDVNDLELAFIYLEPRKMKIVLPKDKIAEFKMTGSKTQTEFEFVNKMEGLISERLSMLKEQRHKINDSINKSKDGLAKLILEKEAAEIDSLWSKTRDQLDIIELKFILENPKSFLSPYYLLRIEEREVITLDSVKSIFNGFAEPIRKSKYGKLITEDIRKKENTLIGTQAPDFKATDLNKETVTLSQFKGKSVLVLDFWASWCVPCRKSIPHLKKIFNKYHSKGLDVIAISVDEDRKAWIDAVKQDSIGKWYNILIAEKWPYGPLTKDDIFQNYYYRGVPELMLIDKNDKIIKRFGGYSKENEESLDSLLNKIFDNSLSK
jgi:thiol-disulfide isomerase/thioredoxin